MTPLDDLTVVDLTQSVAGPVCTQLLEEMGATVIKVEPPSGDNFRNLMNGSMFVPFSHGKQSISVDMKQESGEEIVQQLASEADIFVESFRPGVLDSYDLDYESVSEINSDVIYCSLSGFGHDGPYRSYPGYDPCLQAMSGLMATTGYPDRPPVRIRTSVIDCGTGANAAFAIMAAIRHRDRGRLEGTDNNGTHIDISLYDVAVAWMSYWIANYDQTGELPERSGQKGIGSAPNGIFETRDGYIYICTMTEEMYDRLCNILDRPDLRDNERFQTIPDRMENRDALRAELNDELSQYDGKQLEQELLAEQIPAGAVQSVKDLIEDDPHVEHRSMTTESYNPETDTSVRVSALPFRMGPDLYDGQFSGLPPKKGEHTHDILDALAYSPDQIEELYASGTVFTDE